MRWYVQDKVNQKESHQEEVDKRRRELIDSIGEVMHTTVKERLVICNEEDTDVRSVVKTDVEQVLHVDWTEIVA